MQVGAMSADVIKGLSEVAAFLTPPNDADEEHIVSMGAH